MPLFLFLTLGSVALLTYSALEIGRSAVRHRVRSELRASSFVSAVYIGRELRGLSELTASYAQEPFLAGALADPRRDPAARAQIRRTLRELEVSRPGIGAVFISDSQGRLVDVLPETPALIGASFRTRDWYRGVTRTGRAYISLAYRSAATGRPRVVAAAAPIPPASTHRRRVGILVAAYDLATIQRFADAFARVEGIGLRVTDQAGVVVAGPGNDSSRLIARRDDMRVAAALAGRSGVVETDSGGKRVVSAYAPVPDLGWTVTAEIPKSAAYADFDRLRRIVLLASVVATAVLCVAAWFLARVLRARGRAEEGRIDALRRAEEHALIQAAVLDAATDGIALVDPNGSVSLANARMESLMSSLDFPSTGSLPERQEAFADMVQDPVAYRAAVAAAASDPNYEGTDEFTRNRRTFVRSTAPVRGSAGLIGRIWSVREVTAEREAERLKNELMGTISHELRTPLASIVGFAEILSDRDPEPELRQNYLRVIHGEAIRLGALVDDFLDLQRFEEGAMRLDVAPFDLSELLRDEVELFRGQSDAHRLELDLPDDPVVVLGDRNRIAQVVANLLSNAIKYSPAGGTVAVALAVNGVARVSVRDEGLGIPDDQQAQVFAKFFRVDSSDTRAIGGTGLGLALSKEVVVAHGGEIGFDSAHGEGSAFWFELPLET